VRGFLNRSSYNCLNNAVDIAQHVIVPKSQNEIAEGFEISRTLPVFGAALGMLSAIKLNN